MQFPVPTEDGPMTVLPDESFALLVAFAPVFTRPTYQGFLVLFGSAIITTGRRQKTKGHA